MTVHETHSAAETTELGRALSEHLKPGDVVAFYGDLGAGKTTMIKGICAGLGVTDVVKSPSFVIMTEYRGRIPVYHIDLYRLERPSEVLALGIEELLDRDAVLLVEWGERFPALWPRDRIEIRLAALDEMVREIRVSGTV